MNLTPVGHARNEFFDGIPDRFDPVDAVLTFDGKWLLNLTITFIWLIFPLRLICIQDSI